MPDDRVDRSSLERLVIAEQDILRLQADVKGLESSLAALAARLDAFTGTLASLDLTIKAYGLASAARDAKEEAQRLRGQKARLDREARTNKVANLILTALAGLLGTALISGFLYVNTTYKSYTLDTVGIVILVVVGALAVFLWRAGPPPDI